MTRNRFARLFSPTSGEGDDLGGGGADRGDGLSAEIAAKTAEDVAAVAAEADTAAETAAAAEAEAEAAARDEKGRFAKKDETDEKDTRPKMIPKGRFDEAVAKERARTVAAEARAAELARQIAAVAHTEDVGKLDAEIEVLADKLEAARLDGDKEKVKALASELRMKERQVAVAENTRMSAQAKDQAREEIRLDLTIEKLEQLHPMLNEKDDAFDQDVVDMVLATQRDLIAREKLSPSVALEEATRKVMLKVMPAHREEVAEDAADTKGGLKNAEGKKDGRKEAQIKKNLETAAKQPASMKESGVDSDKHGQSKETPDAGSMTFEEFAALPEATKAKMRGDTV